MGTLELAALMMKRFVERAVINDEHLWIAFDMR